MSKNKNGSDVKQEDIAMILNRINDALEDSEYEAVGYDNTDGCMKVLIERKP